MRLFILVILLVFTQNKKYPFHAAIKMDITFLSTTLQEGADLQSLVSVDANVPVDIRFIPETLEIGEQEVCVEVQYHRISKQACAQVIVLPKATLREEFMALSERFGANVEDVSMFYYDFETKETLMVNEDTWMLAASTIKVPLSMLYIDMIEQGELTYDTWLIDDTIENHIYNALVYSSNEATASLILGFSSFYAYREALTRYSSQDYPAAFYEENLTNAKYMYDVMNTLFHNPTYQYIIDCMIASTQDAYFREYVDDLVIAHKYGDYAGFENDMGIFYAKEPFMAGVFTNNVNGSIEMIGQMGLLFEEYHTKMHQ